MPSEWVPGASEPQLTMLAALGAVASRVGNFVSSDPKISKWLSVELEPPHQIIEMTREWLRGGDLDSRVAALYTLVVGAPNRRRLGTFFTPRAEAGFMVDRWNDLYGAPAAIVDIGAGVGVFSAIAAAKWPEATITSVDVNPVTLGLLGARLELDEALDDRFSLVLEDFTEWVVRRNGGLSGLPSGALLLGNPPYTRAELLPITERHRLHEATKRVCGLRAGLATLIVVQALQQMRPRDGLAQLLPAQWLESDSARGLRELLWRQHRDFELRLIDSQPFDAIVDAVALFVGPEKPRAMAVEWRAGNWTQQPVAGTRVNDSPANWREFATSGATAVVSSDDTIELGSLAVVRRGTATGANRTFVLSTDESARHELPLEVLRPVLSRARGVTDELVLAGDMRILVATEGDRAEHETLDAYLRAAEESGIHHRRLCADRAVWFDLAHDLTTPDLIVGSATRGSFRLIENLAAVHITNNMYGIIWRSPVGLEARQRVLAWLRSPEGQGAILGSSRHQGNGLVKIEPRALRRVGIPSKIVTGMRS